MYSKLKQPTLTRRPSMVPTPLMKASFSPSAFIVDLMRSLYFFESENPSGSIGSRSVSNSSKVSGSHRAARRRRAGSGEW